MQFRWMTIVGVVLILCCADAALADKPPRFAARLANGTRLSGNVVAEWHTNAAQPKLDGQPLLEPGNPLCWLRDRAILPAVLPKAFVETIGGDRLPGVVLDYQSGEETPYEPAPPHFVVRPELRQSPPQVVSEPRVRVLAKFVRRLVWQRRDVDDYQPGTLFYRDGRSVTFRAARFGDGQVQLLLPDGQRKIYFSEIGEIHLPPADLWSAYFDELATLCPNGTGRLMQIETGDGLIATTSSERFLASGTADYLQCVHGIQPAWSLEILWVPTVQIWMRRMFAPHEVPLSRLRPIASQQRSLLGGPGQPWRTNRNVQSGLLRSGGQDFGWGVGVHAISELQYELPPMATAFRTTVGLDRIAGKGGCAKARILTGAPGSRLLFESPLLIGADNAFDSGELKLDGSPQRLVLQVDAAHENRPPGTDPFDIRDMTDWLDPLLQLDPDQLRQELTTRAPKQLAAWRGWSLHRDESTPAAAESAAVTWSTWRDRWSISPGRMLPATLAVNQPFVLEQEFTLGPEHTWLVLAVSHSSESGNNARLEVRLSGEPVADLAVPVENLGAGTPPPLVVSLREYRGQRVRIQILQHPSASAAPVFWRAISLTRQLPTLYQAFEDEGAFHVSGTTQAGSAVVSDEDRHSGEKSVRIPPADEYQLEFPTPINIREKPGLGEYRYLSFAVRKAGEGQFGLGFSTVEATDQAWRYDGGPGDPVRGATKRIWQDKMQDKWVELPRDLFADFGAATINSLTLSALNGGPARFDRVYLGRSIADFELVGQLAPIPINPATVNDGIRPAIIRTAASLVGIRFEDERFSTGIVLSADGDVLTAGHVVLEKDQPAQIVMPDGRVVAAQTRGVFRDQDWGLLKITEAGPWTPAEIMTTPDLPRNLLYVAMAYPKSFVTGDAAVTPPVILEHVTPRLIRCRHAAGEASTGGPLLDQYGRVVGLRSHDSRLGDSVYTRFLDFPAVLARLKNGEVWGRWPVGAGPSIGCDVAPQKAGCRVVHLLADSAAARVGLQPGDIITRLDGQATRDGDEIQAILAARDPGQSVEIVFQRGTMTHSSTITPAPRIP